MDKNDNLADLRPNYLERLRKRTDALTAFLQAFDNDSASTEALETSHRCVHSMISSAAVFGYPELSTAARAAEEAFEKENGSTMIKSRMEHLLEVARHVLEMPVGRGN